MPLWSHFLTLKIWHYFVTKYFFEAYIWNLHSKCSSGNPWNVSLAVFLPEKNTSKDILFFKDLTIYNFIDFLTTYTSTLTAYFSAQQNVSQPFKGSMINYNQWTFQKWPKKSEKIWKTFFWQIFVKLSKIKCHFGPTF